MTPQERKKQPNPYVVFFVEGRKKQQKKESKNTSVDKPCL
jgi:hypothetical protein